MRVSSTVASSGGRVIAGLLAATVACLGLVMATAPTAFAHTDLIDSNPADGATLEQLPNEVSVTFNEKLQSPGYIVVTAPSGAKIAEGEATIAGAVAKSELDPVAILKPEKGRYTLAFRVVSSDGHPVTKTLTFTVNPPANTLGQKTQSSGPVTENTASTDESSPAASEGSGPTGSNGDESFWERHDVHIGWGVGLLAIAAGLLWFERRRHNS